MSVKAPEMNVQCPECSTVFRLDADLIKGPTATVRCSRCRHLFPIRRPVEPSHDEAPPPPSQEVMGPAPIRQRRRLWLPLVFTVVFLTSAAIALLLFFSWPHHARQSAPENVGIHLLHLVETQGYFVDNAKAGRLFIIDGRVRNDFATPRRWILLRAKLYTTDGQEARQQLFYAGNLLSTEQLRGLPLADQLGLIQQTPQGPQVAIGAGQEVSFVVPFGDLPEISKLSDYSVEIVASQSS